MFKRKANAPSNFQQVSEGVLKLPGLRPEISEILRHVDSIVWEQSPPADKPNAIAYVSSDDANDNGKIDKVHFVLSNWPQGTNEEEVGSIVNMVEQTLLHELGHINDFNPNFSEEGSEAFPGGEAVAEQAVRQGERQIQGKLNFDSFNKIEGRNIDMNMLKELQKLANRLDKIGENKFADKLDLILHKIEQ